MSAELVARTREHVCATDHRFKALYRPGVTVHPIPYFGRLAEAEVLTLGLNPSSKEFARSRSWPTEIDDDDLAARLTLYFESTAPPPHRWFHEWSLGLRAIGASFDGLLRRRAAHVDLSPRPTRGATAFNEEPLRAVFLDMLRADAAVLVDALMAAKNAVCVLAAGSATGVYYINEFIDAEIPDLSVRGPWRRGSGSGQTALLELTLPGDRVLPMFFCSTGPTSPGVLSTAIAKNRGHLIEWLRV